MIRSPLCSKCRLEPRQGRQRWCRPCRTTHERQRRRWRRQLGPRHPLNPTGLVLPPGVTDLGFGIEVCGARHHPDSPGRPCGLPFPAGRPAQVYCCSGHGSGQLSHSGSCPLSPAKARRPVERAERPAVIASLPASPSTRIPPSPERKPKGKRSRLWDPAIVEQLKVRIADIPKRARPPETIRVSFIPLSRGYADVRVYRAGLPTRQGLPLHLDLLPEVIEALQGALQHGRTAPGREARRSVTRDEGIPVAGSGGRDGGAAAGNGRTGVAGMWDEDDGWGAWR